MTERVISHIIFWVVVLLLSSPLWIPPSCIEGEPDTEKRVYQVKIGGAMVIVEVER